MKRKEYPARGEAPYATNASTAVQWHPWAYRVAVINPVTNPVPGATEQQIAADASVVVQRALALGATLPDDLVAVARTGTWSVAALTWLQMTLQHQTAGSQAVADDADVQAFRKRLHLLLDHDRFW